MKSALLCFASKGDWGAGGFIEEGFELILVAVIKSSGRDDTDRLGLHLLNKEAFEYYFFRHLVCRNCP